MDKPTECPACGSPTKRQSEGVVFFQCGVALMSKIDSDYRYTDEWERDMESNCSCAFDALVSVRATLETRDSDCVALRAQLRDAAPDAGAALTAEEVESLQYLIGDPDWDVSQRGEVWELLPKLLSAAQRAAPLQGAVRAVVSDIAPDAWEAKSILISVEKLKALRAALGELSIDAK